MHINGNELRTNFQDPSAKPVQGVSKTDHKNASASAPQEDRVEFSKEVQEFRRIQELARQVPEADNSAKVQALASEIREGRDNVRGEQVAEKIIEEHSIDDLV